MVDNVNSISCPTYYLISSNWNQIPNPNPKPGNHIVPNIHKIDHPLCDHLLGQLRRTETPPSQFRLVAHQLTQFLAIEATRSLPTRQIEITTPVAATKASELAESIGIFPILRAGLAMADPLLDLIPTASIFHLGMYRDEATATPVEYYSKLHESQPVDIALIVDPMLATGGSALLAIDAVKRWGVKQISMLSLIASRDGIEAVVAAHPDVNLHTCAIDPILNDAKYIVPGLGDAGDRVFNTLSGA